jgi:NRPS condensation-like uncharacterized protein
MQTTKFNLLDELYLHLDKPDDPFSMHQELRVEGRLDAARLLTAIQYAAGMHPMARAFMLPWKPTDREYRWAIADALAVSVLIEVDCADEIEVAEHRAALLAESVPLIASPPFRCLLAHHPLGDYLIMNISHTVSDGTGQARLMRSIVRAYAGQPDPVPHFHALQHRDLAELFGATSLSEQLRRYTPLAQYLVQSLLPPGRIAVEGGLEDEGFGLHFIKFRKADIERLCARREDDASVNDVLLAALHLAIQDWNTQHGQKTERLTAMMPVNMRPAEWNQDVVGNYSVFVAIGSQSTDRQNFSRTLRAITRWTRWYKETKGTAQLIDLLRGAQWLPLWLKRASRDLIPLTGNRVVDSTALSNLGRLADLGSFGGKAGKVTEFWFSPPARMPLGVSLGVATHRDEMFLSFRYRKAQFSPDAAARFAEVFRRIVLNEPKQVV